MIPSPKTVLVVEDEPFIRIVIVDALIHAGFEVVEAAGAEEALAVLMADAGRVSVVLTDVNMPGAIDGLQLANHVRGVWPRIAVLVASGAGVPAAGELRPGVGFLSKPYDRDHVVARVRTLADAA